MYLLYFFFIADNETNLESYLNLNFNLMKSNSSKNNDILLLQLNQKRHRQLDRPKLIKYHDN